jgi:hypothetical protein
MVLFWLGSSLPAQISVSGMLGSGNIRVSRE